MNISHISFPQILKYEWLVNLELQGINTIETQRRIRIWLHFAYVIISKLFKWKSDTTELAFSFEH